MDTLRSPIPQGSMGGLTGTGRSPQLSSALDSLLTGKGLESSGTRIFSEEVERAEQRAELGSVDERLATQAQERRSERHGSFGQEQSESEPRQRSSDEKELRTDVGVAQPEVFRTDETKGSTGGGVASPATAEHGASQESTQSQGSDSKGQAQSSQPTTLPAQGPANPALANSSGTLSGAQAAAASGTAAPSAISPTEAPGDRATAALATSRTAKSAPSAPAPDARAQEIAEAAEILRQIKVAATTGARRINLELTPLTLGRVQIRVSLRPGAVDAVVEASESTTYSALERQAPELRALLSEATGGRDVTLTLLGGEGGEQRTHQDGTQSEFQATTPQGQAATTNTDPAPRAQPTAQSPDSAAIDTYA